METFFKHQQPSRVAVKRQQKADAEAVWREVCQRVDERDKGRCRVCGRRCNPFATEMLYKAHRHHIIYRSAGGVDTTWNLVTVCPDCHSDEHAHRLRVVGDGDQGIEVWRLDSEETWYLHSREIAVHRVERD